MRGFVVLLAALLTGVLLPSVHGASNAPERPAWDGTWRELVTVGAVPEARGLSSAVYDPVRARMILFGGTDDLEAGTYFGDVWALSLTGEPTWTELHPIGTPPSARLGHAAIYDPVRDRMIVWSGYDGTDVDDVWALSLSGPLTWTRIVPIGPTPGGRGASSLIYDPVRDRLVMFGGYRGFAHNDVWVLPLAGPPVWTELTPTGSRPIGRGIHTAFYDPIRDRMVVFGGGDLDVFNDVWALSLAGEPSWTEILPEGILPLPRTGQCGIYDVLRDRMVVHGGAEAGDLTGPPLEDAWELSLADPPTWTQLFPAGTAPRGRTSASGVYDVAGDAMVFFGGIDEGFYLDDSWALEWGGPAGVTGDANRTGTPRARLRLSGANPLRPGDRIEITLDGPATDGRATLTLFDVQGRRLGVLWAGHTAPTGRLWSGVVQELPIRASGTYWLRAQVGNAAITRALVVLCERE